MEETLDTVLFLSCSTYKIVSEKDSLCAYFLGKKVDRVCALYLQYLGFPSFILWLGVVGFYSVQLYKPVAISSYVLYGLSLLPLTMMSSSFALSVKPVVWDCSRFFDTFYIAINLFTNWCMLGYVNQEQVLGIIPLLLLYAISYFNALYMEAGRVNYKDYDSMFLFSTKESREMAYRNQLNRENTVSIARSNILIDLNVLRISMKSSKLLYEHASIMKASRKRKVSLNTSLNALGVGVGLILQFYTYFLVQLVWTDLGELMILDNNWVRASAADILTFTSVNTIMFMTKKFYLIILLPLKPRCYCKSMIRIPLVSEWSRLIEESKKLHSRKLFVRVNQRSTDQQVQNEFSMIMDENEDNGQHLEDRIGQTPRVEDTNEKYVDIIPYLRDPSFTSHVVCAEYDYLKLARVSVIFPPFGKAMEFNERSYMGKIANRNKENILGKFLNLLNRNTLTSVFILGAGTYELTQNTATVGLITASICWLCMLQEIILLSRFTKRQYVVCFSYFENIFILFNIVIFYVSMSDLFGWLSLRSLALNPLLSLFLVRLIMFDVYHVDSERLSTRMKRIVVDDNFHDNMPFTQYVLHILRDHGLKKMNESAHTSSNENSCSDEGSAISGDDTSNRVFVEMSMKERLVYLRIFGYRHIFSYVIGPVVFVALLIVLQSPLMAFPNERAISIIVIRGKNTTMVRGAIFNIVLFCLKRLYRFLSNPLLSTTITESYFQYPITRSVLEEIAKNQPSSPRSP